MAEDLWLDDRHWAAIEPLLARNQSGAHRKDGRRIISGIVHALKSVAAGRIVDALQSLSPLSPTRGLAALVCCSGQRRPRQRPNDRFAAVTLAAIVIWWISVASASRPPHVARQSDGPIDGAPSGRNSQAPPQLSSSPRALPAAFCRQLRLPASASFGGSWVLLLSRFHAHQTCAMLPRMLPRAGKRLRGSDHVAV